MYKVTFVKVNSVYCSNVNTKEEHELDKDRSDRESAPRDTESR